MSDDLSASFTHREEAGEFLVSVHITVHEDFFHVAYSTSEFDAEFSIDNFVGMHRAEAYCHPALIAQFIERTVGDGEVKFHYYRRSDELARLLKAQKDQPIRSGKPR